MQKNFYWVTLIIICYGFIQGCANTNSGYYKSNSPNNNIVVQTLPEITKIVVLVLPRKNAPDRHIENKFIQGLINKRYTVASRYDLPKLIQEQVFQQSSLTESKAAEIGKILNADAVLIYRSNRIGKGED